MTYLRPIVLIAMMLMLAGCFRQADDTSFDAVNSEDVAIITPTAEGVQIIVPEITQDPAIFPTSESSVTGNTPIPRATLTPTIVIISPPTNQPLPTNTPNLVSTATTITIITPDVPSQIQFPTATESAGVETRTTTGASTGGNGLITPTDLFEDEQCEYQIQPGDTLFRLALRYEVSLQDIYTLNNLRESSILQIGQVVLIPDCGDNIVPTSTPDAESTEEAVLEGTPTDQIIHVVKPGETLYYIAIQYGVTMRSIIEANNLTNPDRLNLNQQLIIPK